MKVSALCCRQVEVRARRQQSVADSEPETPGMAPQPWALRRRRIISHVWWPPPDLTVVP